MKFYHSEKAYHPMSNNVGAILDALPAGIYKIEVTPHGIFFPETSIGEPPAFTHGNVEEKATFWLDRFESLGRSMGVWLNGLKGTGKTYQARAVVRQAVERGMPVFIVDGPFSGQHLSDIVEMVNRPCVLFMDEFDKHYGTGLSDDNNSSEDLSAEKQGNLLSFLDGTSGTKVLTVMTTNTAEKVSSFIRGRAGRVRYREEYSFLEPEAVLAIGAHLHPEIPHNSLVLLSRGLQWTMDSLRVALEEIAAFPDMHPGAAIARLNLTTAERLLHWRVEWNGMDLGDLVNNYGTAETRSYDSFMSGYLGSYNLVVSCPVRLEEGEYYYQGDVDEAGELPQKEFEKRRKELAEQSIRYTGSNAWRNPIQHMFRQVQNERGKVEPRKILQRIIHPEDGYIRLHIAGIAEPVFLYPHEPKLFKNYGNFLDDMDF